MRRGGVRLLGLTLVVVLGAVACSSSGGGAAHPTASAAHQLRRAARKTLAASSYKLRMGEVGVKHPHVVTAEYQAPDRSQTGSGPNTMIVIGNTSYLGNPDGSHTFTRNTMPATASAPLGAENFATASLASVLYPALQARKGVTVDGNNYVATTPKHGEFGVARYIYTVADGRVTNLRVEQRAGRKPFNREFHYFDFGVPNAIKPPPADRVRVGTSESCAQGSVPPTTPPATAPVCVLTPAPTPAWTPPDP